MSLSSSRAEMVSHDVRIDVDEAEVLRTLERPYARWVAESREDDLHSGGPQDEFAIAGYPSLPQVLRTATLLNLVVARYLVGELLRPLTWDGVQDIKYWLDDVVDCSFDGARLTLKGRCYSRRAEPAIPAIRSQRSSSSRA